jgi:glycosyltransferase involved in cell wall biosynthesis
MLDEITPVILTYNEEANIQRTLEQLRWANDAVLVDSFSTDRTLEIVRQFPNVRIFQRAFDAHANQWNFAIRETGVVTPWVLALDADYILTGEGIQELAALRPSKNIGGYRARFTYCVNGYRLRGSLYPPVTVLFRLGAGTYCQDGHTQRLSITTGDVLKLHHPIVHDDRKPLSRWIAAQDSYAQLEAEWLAARRWGKLRWRDRLRRLYVIAPFAVFIYCLFWKGGLRDGRYGLYYALQRMFAEGMLSLRLIEVKLIRSRSSTAKAKREKEGCGTLAGQEVVQKKVVRR